MTYSFLELLIFFWLTQVDIYSLKFISHHITEILYLDTDQTPKETNHEIKTSIFTCFFHEIKTNIFTCFINIKLKFLMNNFYFLFPVSWTHFQKQPFPDALQSSCSEKFRNISNEKGTPTEVFFCQYCYFFHNSFFIEHLRWLLLHLLKVIKQLFCKGVYGNVLIMTS